MGEESDVLKKTKGMDIESLSDRTSERAKSKPPLAHFTRMDPAYVPALAKGGREEKHAAKRVRWNPDVDNNMALELDPFKSFMEWMFDGIEEIHLCDTKHKYTPDMKKCDLLEKLDLKSKGDDEKKKDGEDEEEEQEEKIEEEEEEFSDDGDYNQNLYDYDDDEDDYNMNEDNNDEAMY